MIFNLTPAELAYGSFFAAAGIVVVACLGLWLYVSHKEKHKSN
mgnify:FL=1|jgi:hypothetical protein